MAYLPGAYIDQGGLTLPGAAKWTGNIGAEYRKPHEGHEYHASFNTALTSRYNNIDTLSSYGWVSGGATTDLSLGVAFKGGFDVSLVVKNAFDNRKHEPAWLSYSPNPYPRWYGVTFSGKL